MWKRLVLMLCVAALTAGCAVAPALRPRQARDTVLAEPSVAAWYESHSAPAVLSGLPGWQARRWQRYEPGVTVDLVEEGFLVKLDSAVGSEPRRLEVLVDRTAAQVLEIRQK